MAIFQGDAVFRRIVELILKDIKENPYIIQDILSDFVTDDMLAMYGQKEIDNAKKWFAENEVSIFLPHRMDVEKMPCITISVGSNVEDKSLARLGDLTSTVEAYEASDIGKTIQYMVTPFTYTSYDQLTGYFETPASVDLTIVEPGMVVVDPASGNGWVVSKKDNEGFYIAENTVVSVTEVGILPQYRIFKARREIATFQENITLGCHVHGDPSSLLWLHSIVMYGMLRYREGMLESRNFQLSNIATSDMIKNESFADFGENAYSRFITVTGQVENTWIKAPKRIIETTGASPEITIIDCDGNKIT